MTEESQIAEVPVVGPNLMARLGNLLSGANHYYGQYSTEGRGAARTIYGSLTSKQWGLHLKGFPGNYLGIAPTTGEGTCVFSVINVDYDPWGEEIDPNQWGGGRFVAVRSKSRGWHIFLFHGARTPLEASTEMIVLTASLALDMGKVSYFPSANRNVDPRVPMPWILMPFFGMYDKPDVVEQFVMRGEEARFANPQ